MSSGQLATCTGAGLVRDDAVAGNSSEARWSSVSLVKGMVLVSGGSFVMGSLDFSPEERPRRDVRAADLWVDEHPVTNAQWRGRDTRSAAPPATPGSAAAARPDRRRFGTGCAIQQL